MPYHRGHFLLHLLHGRGIDYMSICPCTHDTTKAQAQDQQSDTQQFKNVMQSLIYLIFYGI